MRTNRTSQSIIVSGQLVIKRTTHTNTTTLIIEDCAQVKLNCLIRAMRYGSCIQMYNLYREVLYREVLYREVLYREVLYREVLYREVHLFIKLKQMIDIWDKCLFRGRNGILIIGWFI